MIPTMSAKKMDTAHWTIDDWGFRNMLAKALLHTYTVCIEKSQVR